MLFSELPPLLPGEDQRHASQAAEVVQRLPLRPGPRLELVSESIAIDRPVVDSTMPIRLRSQHCDIPEA